MYLPRYLCFDSARRDYIQWRSRPLNSTTVYSSKKISPHFYSECVAILYDENVSPVSSISCKDMISLGVVLTAAFTVYFETISGWDWIEAITLKNKARSAEF